MSRKRCIVIFLVSCFFYAFVKNWFTINTSVPQKDPSIPKVPSVTTKQPPNTQKPLNPPAPKEFVPPKATHSGGWLEFLNYEMLLWSAYHDLRAPGKPLIRILMFKTHPQKHSAQCVVALKGGDSLLFEGTLVSTDSEAKNSQQNWKYEPYYLICELGELPSEPYAVAVRVNEQTSAYLPVSKIVILEKRPHLITLCTKALYNFKDWLRLATFIEFYKISGISKIIFYKNSVSPDVEIVIQHYIQKRLVEVVDMPRIPFPPPEPSYVRAFESYHHFGQQVQIQDCIFRTTNVTHFWTDVDVDEFFGAKETGENFLTQLIESNFEADTGGIQIRNTFWDGHWPTITSIKNYFLPNINLAMLSNFRTGEIKKVTACCEKMVVRPEAVDRKSVHKVFAYMPGYKQKEMSPDRALMYHLRALGPFPYAAKPFEQLKTALIGNLTAAIDEMQKKLNPN